MAATITLAWDPSPDPTVTGYRLYFAPTNGEPRTTNSVDVGNVCEFTLTNVVNTPTWFFVTAYNAQQIESDPSNVIVDTPLPDKPAPPSKLRRVIQRTQASTDLKTWSDIAVLTLPRPETEQEFIRTVLEVTP